MGSDPNLGSDPIFAENSAAVGEPRELMKSRLISAARRYLVTLS